MALIMLTLPVSGPIHSGFGMRMHPILKKVRMHNGVDIVVGTGTPVGAAAAGKVIFSGPDGEAGNAVKIEHAPGIETIYAHNSVLLVHVGQMVEKGEVIAKSGSTGLSTGPHVHFGVKINGAYVDPQKAVSMGVNSTATGITPNAPAPGGTVNQHSFDVSTAELGILAVILFVANMVFGGDD